ncbi:hypothetical protein BZG36_01694 [Bifiguratus adelaidae]|uniref:N-acetylgalactosaminide beta-1,3-galactosyltransferase n=1 Tax=Bifiguratus adelaidae TaxID=1938954 RepID=A0A261Y4I2_9FUNG|nr:hypothetical protein BZG36_01694 [Bifiguratus adelaidae]
MSRAHKYTKRTSKDHFWASKLSSWSRRVDRLGVEGMVSAKPALVFCLLCIVSLSFTNLYRYRVEVDHAVRNSTQLTLLVHTGEPTITTRYASMRQSWLSDERWPYDRITFTTGNTSNPFWPPGLDQGLVSVTDAPRRGLAPELPHNMNERVLQSLIYAYRHTDSDWYYKADDDTYLVASRATDAKMDDCTPILHKNISYASGGTGYLLSRKAVELIVRQETEGQGCWRLVEDMTIGFCLNELGIKCIDAGDAMLQRIHTSWSRLNPKLAKAIAIHKVLPEDLEVLEKALGVNLN